MRKTMLQSVLCACLSPLLLAQQVTGPSKLEEFQPAVAKPDKASASSPPVKISIPIYTRVDLRLEQEISSADAHVGDRVRFTLVNDLTAKGRVVAPAGTSCYATVKRVRPKSAKRNGSVKLSGPVLDLGHGRRVLLTDSASDPADDVEMAVALLTAAAISAPIWAPGLLFELVQGAIRPHPAAKSSKRPDPVDSVMPEGRHFVFVTRRAVCICADRLVGQSPGPG